MFNSRIFDQLIGKKCWRAWDGLLPAIFFELGEKNDERTGEISLCFDTCPWQIFENDRVIANSKINRKGIDLVLPKFVGKRISSASADVSQTTTTFVFENLAVVAHLNEENDGLYLIDQHDHRTTVITREILTSATSFA